MTFAHSVRAGRWLAFATLLYLSCNVTLVETTQAQDASDQKLKELFLPGESFQIGERTAFIMWPEPAKRQQPQPWVMYAPTLPGYPDRHEQWMHQKFLDAGIAVAGIDMGEAYGSPQGTAGLTTLYQHLVTERQFAEKPVLLGRSRGGLWVSSWAISHPDKVAGIIAIYPVFDLTTYPGLEQAAPAYGVTPQVLSEQLSKWNPIARADVLAQAKIPMAIIHGDVDTVVPLEQNSQTMANIYAKAGASSVMYLEVVSGQGHNHWQGFFRSQSLVDHAIRWASCK